MPTTRVTRINLVPRPDPLDHLWLALAPSGCVAAPDGTTGMPASRRLASERNPCAIVDQKHQAGALVRRAPWRPRVWFSGVPSCVALVLFATVGVHSADAGKLTRSTLKPDRQAFLRLMNQHVTHREQDVANARHRLEMLASGESPTGQVDREQARLQQCIKRLGVARTRRTRLTVALAAAPTLADALCRAGGGARKKPLKRQGEAKRKAKEVLSQHGVWLDASTVLFLDPSGWIAELLGFAGSERPGQRVHLEDPDSGEPLTDLLLVDARMQDSAATAITIAHEALRGAFDAGRRLVQTRHPAEGLLFQILEEATATWIARDVVRALGGHSNDANDGPLLVPEPYAPSPRSAHVRERAFLAELYSTDEDSPVRDSVNVYLSSGDAWGLKNALSSQWKLLLEVAASLDPNQTRRGGPAYKLAVDGLSLVAKGDITARNVGPLVQLIAAMHSLDLVPPSTHVPSVEPRLEACIYAAARDMLLPAILGTGPEGQSAVRSALRWRAQQKMSGVNDLEGWELH